MAGFIWSLFLIFLSVILSIIAIGGFAYFTLFGTVPRSVGQFTSIPGELRQLQNDNIAFQTEIQTQAADLSARESRDRELISVLEEEISELQTLGDNLNEQADISATIQTQAGEDRETMAEIQTIETDLREQMDEIQDRTDRVARFLSRLSDLAGDTSIDLDLEEEIPLEEETPSVEEPTATATRTARPTSPTAAATASPTSEPTATSAITPTSAEATSEAVATSPADVETATDATPEADTTEEPSAAETATAAPTEETPEAETPPEGEQRTYVVQPGDTLRSIAEQFDTNVQALIEANNLTPAEADSLQVGQELIIP